MDALTSEKTFAYPLKPFRELVKFAAASISFNTLNFSL